MAKISDHFAEHEIIESMIRLARDFLFDHNDWKTVPIMANRILDAIRADDMTEIIAITNDVQNMAADTACSIKRGGLRKAA